MVIYIYTYTLNPPTKLYHISILRHLAAGLALHSETPRLQFIQDLWQFLPNGIRGVSGHVATITTTRCKKIKTSTGQAISGSPVVTITSCRSACPRHFVKECSLMFLRGRAVLLAETHWGYQLNVLVLSPKYCVNESPHSDSMLHVLYI